MPEDYQMTTGLFLKASMVAALADILLLILLSKLVSRKRFMNAGRFIFLLSGLFYGFLWTIVLHWGWDWFYMYVFPAWMKQMGWAWGAAYAFVGWGMWWLARKFSRPILAWFLLGGVEGVGTHAWAIWVGGVIRKPPVIQGSSPAAVLLFACFEKIFYWLIILGLAVGVSIIIQKLRRSK